MQPVLSKNNKVLKIGKKLLIIPDQTFDELHTSSGEVLKDSNSNILKCKK